ncbi:hypothetical protein GUITHDRAFT_72189, partial [Guillardia theta CCMP2712]
NRSLFCLESSSSIREAFIKIAEWEWFNRTVLGFIILNCILLVLDDPRIFYTRLGDCSSWSNVQPLLQVTEYLFTCLFSMEMVIKIIARGFVLHKHAYLRDPWNWIDFVVVICSLISLVPGLIQNVTVLRVARILRPLRTMTRIKGMQPLIKTVISSLRALTNVVLLLAFMMTVFGILALELAAGQLRGRCYVDPTPGANNFSESARTILMSQQIPYIAEAYNMIGSYNAGISFCNSLNPCPQFAIDGVYYNSVCSFKKWCYHDWCSEWNNNPFYEVDNFLECLVVLWETLTLEGWTTDLLYNYQASWGDWSARIYFVMWVLVGTFFVLQLALAVLSDAYLQAVEEEKSEKEMEALHEEAILKPNDVMLVVFNSFFVNLITVAIICNSILCGDDLSQCPDFPTSLNAVLDNVNLSLTIIFVIEMVLKWIALGFKQYFSDGFNVFDCFVVIASTVELIIGALSTSGSNGSSLSALRGLRILRLLRLAKSWEEMRRIMTSLGRAISSLGPVTIFWVMFMYMFALLAMQFFGGNLKYNKTDSPRSNFDSFVPSELGHGSFFIVFQIISTENWNTIMYNSMTAVGSSSPWNCLLTIFIVAFGNYIVMNLFISILLQGFGETDGEEGGKKENKSLASKMAAGFRKILANVTKKAKEMPRRLSTEFQQKLRATSAETQEALAFAASIRIHPEATSDGESEDPNLFMSIRFFGKNRKLKIANHRSFFILPRKHPVRVFVAFCIQNPIFETFILLCILITSVTLLIDAPGRTVNIPPCCSIAYENNILSTMDVVFTLVFFSEMILKLIVDGLLFHQYAYLRDSWNCLDCFVVVISMLSSFGSAASAKSFKVLRALRALRPLRVIKRNKSLKIAVVCLLSSIPAMMNVMVVVLFWFVIYAMLGVQFFRGKLYRFVNSPPDSPLLKNKPDGTSPTSSGVWLDKDYSFDNLAEALSTLFQMSTTEGWMDVMSAAVDVVEVGVTPIPNQNPWFSLYCVVHIILGAFILLNLIVAEVIKNYIRIKSMNDGITPFLTPEQQEWKEMRRAISSLKPLKRREGPSNKFRSFFYHLINHAWFEYFITFSICANVIVMLMNTYNQDECVVAIIFWINFSFSCVFVTEAVLKLIGLGPKWYFTDKWNILDFLVVLISVSTLSIDVSFPGLKPLRALRIVRVFRLVRRSKGIRQMIVTLLESMPSLWNIGVVLFLSLIIFAVMGVNLFYNVNTGQDVYGRMSDLASYSSLDSAIFLLFRQTTGEAWNGIMFYCMEYKACSKCYGPYLGDGCGNQWEGIIFHVMWQILGAYVLVQLFTAVIIENFAELSKEESSVLPMDKLQEFVEVWMELDPGAKGRISVTLVPELIKKLSPPLGLKREHITEPMLIKVRRGREQRRGRRRVR